MELLHEKAWNRLSCYYHLLAWFFGHPYITLPVQFFKEQSDCLQSDPIIHVKKA